MAGQNMLTVYDDETQDSFSEAAINRWGEPITAVAVRKGMPPDAKPWTRRNSDGNGTIFEWDNA